jgi:hypothetical protein
MIGSMDFLQVRSMRSTCTQRVFVVFLLLLICWQTLWNVAIDSSLPAPFTSKRILHHNISLLLTLYKTIEQETDWIW